ncbi:MAG: hypothetical protein HY600_06810 [Candidatus Omnitrophica bacterium]|nr:hypothetical protein [Candidatus Omnitrophota bacterium]
MALALLASLVVSTPGWALTLRILDAAYDQHVADGELWTVRVRVQNLEPNAQAMELVVILTNQVTGEETTPIDAGGPSIVSGGIHTFVQTASVSAGRYTVTFRILDGNAARSDQITGKYPLHVGTNTELLHVFPDALHLGTIPPGRFMQPVPLEIRWDFYRFNRLGADQPFTIRVYSDNSSRYRGIPGALLDGSPAGLVSEDGRFTIPMKIWTVNFGPDFDETGWKADTMGPPPVDDDTYWKGPLLTSGGREVGSVAWLRIPDYSEMSSDPTTWRRLIGQEPDNQRFVTDTNVTGDYTLTSPLTVYLATEAWAAAVQGRYAATLVVELWSP